jgi:glycyl-tRNA synthetase beta chain
VATFLLEIGTEELPADFVRLALPQLEALAQQDLRDARLIPGSLRATGTPRRLALIVEQLPERQDDLQEERKGPPAAQAFRDGQPTAAAIGFARRCGLEPSQLNVRQTDKGAFVYATVTEAGQASADVLARLVPHWITSLQGRRFMRWGAGEQRFSRPIRWLVALLDNTVVPVDLREADPPVASGRFSRGHRLHPEPLSLAEADDYARTLAAAGVQVERTARGQTIRESVAAAAASHRARADMPEALLDELVDLVEAPQLLQGRFDERFLALPAEVLSTVMRVHQRYVPLVRADATDDPLALAATDVLLPAFLCIGNGQPQAAATIQRGNERVLRARLADAEFFVAADLAIRSAERCEALARVTFAEGLGSLLDRVHRLEWLTDALLQRLPQEPATADHARRAASLCKHDLVSQMVGEFPELQGVMGGKYLLAEGEPRAVAQAVLEHYQPRGAGDALPASDAGALLAMAERLELLVSIFAKGERPSGSSDPYALRRAGNGILQILWERCWSLDFHRLLLFALDQEQWKKYYPDRAIDPGILYKELGEFIRQRLLFALEDDGVDADIAQAVAGDTIALESLLAQTSDARLRGRLIQRLRNTGALKPVQEVVQRAAKLAVHSTAGSDELNPESTDLIDPLLFEKDSEHDLHRALILLSQVVADVHHLTDSSPGLYPMATAEAAYQRLGEQIAQASVSLRNFFDGDHSVMVMADEQPVRTNRLNLLAVLRNQAAVLADFSRLSG